MARRVLAIDPAVASIAFCVIRCDGKSEGPDYLPQAWRSFRIELWRRVNLLQEFTGRDKGVKGLEKERLVRFVKGYLDNLMTAIPGELTDVVIEKQHGRNKTSHLVSMLLFMYFLQRYSINITQKGQLQRKKGMVNVCMQHAKHKLRVLEESGHAPKKTKYNQRKAMAVEKCKQLLNDCYAMCPEDFQEAHNFFFKKLTTIKQRDDPADALLHGLWRLQSKK